jgi:hypothetical protein
MKYGWWVMFLLAGFSLQAQPRGGRIGTFTYTSSQGLSAENFVDLTQLKDGSLVAKTYTAAQMYQLQAMGTRTVWFGSSLRGVETSVHSLSGEGIWYSNKGFVRLQGDSLQLWKPMNNIGSMVHLPLGNGSMLVQNAYNNPRLWWLKGEELIGISFPNHEKWDSVGLVYDFYSGLPCLIGIKAQPPLQIYRFDTTSRSFSFLASYPVAVPFGFAFVFGSDSVWVNQLDKTLSLSADGSIRQMAAVMNLHNPFGLVASYGANPLWLYQHHSRTYWHLPFEDRISALVADAHYQSIYVGADQYLRRVFPHVSSYPNLYKAGNTMSTHTLMQTQDGAIYAGSYNGHLTRLEAMKQQKVEGWSHRFLPGGLAVGQQLIYFSELPIGLYSKTAEGQPRLIGPPMETGYYLAFSADSSKILAGFGGKYKFGISSVSSVLAGKPQWQWIDSTKGMRLPNVLTLSEDRHGRIWYGRNSQGWGVYDAKQGTAQTWLMEEGQTNFGALCSFVDSYGHVFLGGTRGLWWVDATKPGKISANDARRIMHPLLGDGVTISSLRQWRHYLVIAAGKHILLLNLKSFNTNVAQSSLLFLHPQETNFTGETYQNAMLVDRTDSSLWVATSDMLYRLDMNSWLQQPKRSITPQCLLVTGHDTVMLQPGKPVGVDPTATTLELMWPYQVADNFPRYVQTALVAEGDSLVWSEPSFTTQMVAQNRRQGRYTFHLRILQHDGTITTWTFPITIRKFLWQQWWFWLLLSLAVTGMVSYLVNLRRKNQVAEARALQMQAEAEALRSEQNRQLTTMQVKSLSNQFRPHFILNALNTIGAQLYDKPEVDEVLGQLGDSIGIIFKNAQHGSVSHSLEQEWRLVQSVINIKQMEYRHAVQVHVKDSGILESQPDWRLPMGIIQIPVENALIHGLRNKEEGSKDLWIDMFMDNDSLKITVTDNGVGRKATAALSNYRSNGVGSKNLLAIIELLNANNADAISYNIKDLADQQTGESSGTRISISIPKHYKYEL